MHEVTLHSATALRPELPNGQRSEFELCLSRTTSKSDLCSLCITSQIKPLAVGRGPTNVTFDFTYHSRTTSQQLDELGRLLANVCNVTPQVVRVAKRLPPHPRTRTYARATHTT